MLHTDGDLHDKRLEGFGDISDRFEINVVFQNILN